MSEIWWKRAPGTLGLSSVLECLWWQLLLKPSVWTQSSASSSVSAPGHGDSWPPKGKLTQGRNWTFKIFSRLSAREALQILKRSSWLICSFWASVSSSPRWWKYSNSPWQVQHEKTECIWEIMKRFVWKIFQVSCPFQRQKSAPLCIQPFLLSYVNWLLNSCKNSNEALVEFCCT